MNAAFGALGDRQFGMGYGAMICASAFLFLFTQGIAARGAVNGDVFVVGAIGARLRKGSLVITGFAVMGLATIVLGLTSNELVAVGAAVVIGIFNLVYIIPSQTLFAERTPEGMMGRVVAIRSSIVMGALTGAMAISAGLADHLDVGLIIAFTGVLTVLAAIVAAWLPAVRDA